MNVATQVNGATEEVFVRKTIERLGVRVVDRAKVPLGIEEITVEISVKNECDIVASIWQSIASCPDALATLEGSHITF